METLLAVGEKYAERSLRDKLDFATDTLMPSPGYNLTLEGLQTPILTIKELSAYFGVELDQEAGALVSLGYNIGENKLSIDRVIFPIKGSEQVAQLVSVEAGGYIPAIDGFMPEFGQEGIVHQKRQSAIHYEKGEELLQGFGISQAPLDSPAAYKAWRDNVLEQSSGWHLIETLLISDAITEDMTQYTTLRREDALSLRRERMADIRQFTRTIVQHDRENDTQHFTEQVLETTRGATSSDVRLFLSTYSKTPDLIFGELESNKTEPKLTAIELNEDSYTDTSVALEKVIADLYSRKY